MGGFHYFGRLGTHLRWFDWRLTGTMSFDSAAERKHRTEAGQ